MRDMNDVTDATRRRWETVLRASRAFDEDQIAQLLQRDHQFIAGDLAIIEPPAPPPIEERTAA